MNSPSSNLRRTIEKLQKLSYRAVTIFDKCKSCGICIKYCPLNIRMFNFEGKAITINSIRSCGGCSVCYQRCPNNAIELSIQKKNYLKK